MNKKELIKVLEDVKVGNGSGIDKLRNMEFRIDRHPVRMLVALSIHEIMRDVDVDTMNLYHTSLLIKRSSGICNHLINLMKFVDDDVTVFDVGLMNIGYSILEFITELKALKMLLTLYDTDDMDGFDTIIKRSFSESELSETILRILNDKNI